MLFFIQNDKTLLLSSFLDVITVFIDLMTITLLLLSHPLFFWSQRLIMMLFIQNNKMQWLRRLLLLGGLTHGIFYLVPHMFVRSLVSGFISLNHALVVLLHTIRLALLSVVFNRNMVMTMMRLLLLSLI
jgi:hypothetical protein